MRRIEDFFRNDERVSKYFYYQLTKHKEIGSHSITSIIISSVNDILDKIEELEEEADRSDDCIDAVTAELQEIRERVKQEFKFRCPECNTPYYGDEKDDMKCRDENCQYINFCLDCEKPLAWDDICTCNMYPEGDVRHNE